MVVAIGITAFSKPSMASEGKGMCPEVETITGSTTSGGSGGTPFREFQTEG